MALPLRVLIVEDSAEDTELLLEELRHGGFEPVCERVQTAGAMTAALKKQAWDIVIADYTMPNFSAPAALELLQKSGLDLPFIIVSGSIGEDIAVASMKAGAHDYMMKGELKRLIPGIERELREAEGRRQRKQAEEQLRQSEERFRQLAENIKEVFWLSNPETTQILYVSPAYQEIWGRSTASLYENPKSFVDAIHPEDKPHVLKVLEQQAVEGTFDHEYRIVRPDGSVRWIRDRGFPIRDETGRLYRVAGIAEDITERKQAEEQLRRQVEELERFNRLAVGRELRMVELKGRINDLSQQLGKAPPYPHSDIQKDET
jgi:two-component system cell cycle sensor histidine kinase/response regulator CckA